MYSDENQIKGQRTAFDYINSGDGKLSLIEYQSLIKDIYSNDNNLKRKYQNLIYNEDINKKDIRDEFIERNLNDTRYASKVFLNGVQNFFKSKSVETKVKVIKVSFTHQMRIGLNIKKDRDESYAHHAIDAVLICYAQMGYDTFVDMQNPYLDIETGEILNINEFRKKTTEKIYTDALYQKKWKLIIKNLLDAESKVKYWYKPDRKANRKISDDTIYGTRTIDGEIYKINYFDIRNNDAKEKFDKYKDKTLMKMYDKKTYEMLLKIMKEYSEDKNPFTAYEKDTGNKIRKYAKNGNGAVVSKIKYLDNKVVKYIDISHKYGYSKNLKRVVLGQLVPYRTDVYFNNDTKKYKFIGVKQYILKYEKGKIQIDINAYEILLKENGILNETDSLESINNGAWDFKLSFYDNEYIKYELDKNGKTEIFNERHHSLNNVNKIETKPVAIPEFIKQNIVTITKVKNVQKIITNILGDKTYISNEKFS